MECLNFFTKKELYVMEHTAAGVSTKIASIPKRYKRKVIYDNMHLMQGMSFTPTSGIPQMNAYSGRTDFACVSYLERNKFDGHNQAIMFFIDDYHFRDAVWCNLEQTTFSLRKFDYYFTPDLSMWKDLPTNYYNVQNVYRTRFVGAYWQLCGYNVIPTASWGDLDSFLYCFDGLPTHSVLAVSSRGNKSSLDAYNRWCYGLHRLEEEKQPTLIIVYGEEVDVPNMTTPIQFIPDFISTRLRKIIKK